MDANTKDKPELDNLASEILSTIMEHCQDETLARICVTDKRIHEHALRERHSRVQTTNFGLVDQPDMVRHNQRTRGVPIKAGWPRGPTLWGDDYIDIATRIMWQDNLPAYKTFLSWGLNIRHYNQDGWTILSLAFRLSNLGIFKFLQENNHILPTDVSIPMSVEENVHTIAAGVVCDGKDEIVEYLIDLAGNSFFEALDIPSALNGYSTLKPSTMAKIIPLDYPFSIVDPDDRQNPFHYAMINVDPGMLDVTLAHSTPECINSPSTNGQTVLWYALDSGNYDAIKKLLAHGADPTVEDADGWTVLHRACHCKDALAARLFLDHGANPNQGDGAMGGTPLHCLCRSLLETPLFELDSCRVKASRVYSLMVARGAVTDVSTEWGQTLQELLDQLPEGYLANMGHIDIV